MRRLLPLLALLTCGSPAPVTAGDCGDVTAVRACDQIAVAAAEYYDACSLGTPDDGAMAATGAPVGHCASEVVRSVLVDDDYEWNCIRGLRECAAACRSEPNDCDPYWPAHPGALEADCRALVSW